MTGRNALSRLPQSVTSKYQSTVEPNPLVCLITNGYFYQELKLGMQIILETKLVSVLVSDCSA